MPTYPLITTAPDHYDRHKVKRTLSLAVIPPSAFLYDAPSHFCIIVNDDSAMDARVNGNTRTWKRTPRIEVPCKIGFREHFTLTSTDGQSWDSTIPYRVLSTSTDSEA